MMNESRKLICFFACGVSTVRMLSSLILEHNPIEAAAWFFALLFFIGLINSMRDD